LFPLFSYQVIFLQRLKDKETRLESLLVLDLLVSLGRALNSLVDLVVENMIPRIVLRLIAEVKSFLRYLLLDLLIDPFLKDK
jgi:hypothetical protein